MMFGLLFVVFPKILSIQHPWTPSATATQISKAKTEQWRLRQAELGEMGHTKMQTTWKQA